MSDRSTLIHLLLELSVRHGEFILKSGQKSDFYVDVRRTALNQSGAVHIAQAVRDVVLPEVKAIGGVELGAVSIVGSVIALDTMEGATGLLTLDGFVVRKHAKSHGLGRAIENCPPEGTKVAILEDVTTTGGSLENAITAAEVAGLEVVQAITVVDRQEGAEANLRAGGFTGVFTAIVTRTNLSKPASGGLVGPVSA